MHMTPARVNGRVSAWRRRERRQEEIFKALLKTLIKDSAVSDLSFLAHMQ